MVRRCTSATAAGGGHASRRRPPARTRHRGCDSRYRLRRMFHSTTVPRRPAPGARGPGRRRPGDAWPDGGQGRSAQDPPPLSRPRPGGLRRFGRRLLRAVLPVRDQARGVQRQSRRAQPSSWRATGEPTVYLRRLEAMLLVADQQNTFLLSGTGDLIEPDDGVAAIGSGGPVRAGRGPRARRGTRSLDARAIAEQAMTDRRGHLHLHQRQHHHRGTVSRLRRAHETFMPIYLPENVGLHRRSDDARGRSSRNSTSTSSVSARPSAPSPSRCAIACAGRSCRRTWPRRWRRRTS